MVCIRAPYQLHHEQHVRRRPLRERLGVRGAATLPARRVPRAAAVLDPAAVAPGQRKRRTTNQGDRTGPAAVPRALRRVAAARGAGQRVGGVRVLAVGHGQAPLRVPELAHHRHLVRPHLVARGQREQLLPDPRARGARARGPGPGRLRHAPVPPQPDPPRVAQRRGRVAPRRQRTRAAVFAAPRRHGPVGAAHGRADARGAARRVARAGSALGRPPGALVGPGRAARRERPRERLPVHRPLRGGGAGPVQAVGEQGRRAQDQGDPREGGARVQAHQLRHHAHVQLRHARPGRREEGGAPLPGLCVAPRVPLEEVPLSRDPGATPKEIHRYVFRHAPSRHSY